MKPSIDIETFTWDNLQADIYFGLHANTMWLYLEGVVTPALDAIDARYDELSLSDEPIVVFQFGDVKALRKATIETFALSVQSLWERQLREFLKNCARELKHSADYVERLESASWAKLLKQFKELRGLPLEDFDSFPDFELLQLLGNACRHGDGKSAKMLYERWPELWPNWPPAPPAGWSGPLLANVPNHPLFSGVSLHRSVLVRLIHAVIWFWDDHNYIYTNSIEPKSSSIEGALAKMREKRARRR
jgi:hypothetical protein